MINKKNKLKLSQLLNHVKNEIPFYEKKIGDIDINEANVEQIFSDLPIVHKSDIMNDYFSFINKSVDIRKLKTVLDSYNLDFGSDYNVEIENKNYFIECTSGTTGSPFISIKTERERLALSNRLWKSRFIHNNKDPRKMFLFVHTENGQYPFPFSEGFTLDHNMREMQYISTRDYEWWHIFPSYLINYSLCIQKANIAFPNLKGIECNGAYISKEEREYYNNIFKCKIVNNYGCREIWNIAYDDREANLVLNPDIIFELVDENGKIIRVPGKVGYVVITSLNLLTMPFIRYYLGDMAFYKADANGCVQNQIDFLPTRNFISGSKVYGNAFFKEVAVSIIQNNNLKMLRYVSVKEVEHGFFKVMFGCDPKYSEIIEANFLQDVKFFSSIYKIDTSKWRFVFQYTNRLDSPEKSIFVSLA